MKEAVSPSVAESLRAVFAGILWHEGIVHDAMACASFLKFHPKLKKQFNKMKDDKVLKRERSPSSLSKEQKARLRHSVEVAASSYLRIAPSTLEALNWSVANANANKNQVCKPVALPIKEEGSGDTSSSKETLLGAKHVPGTESMSSSPKLQGSDVKLPPALHHLVILWEEVSAACKKAIAQQMILPSPMNAQAHCRNVELDNKKDNKTERDKKQRKKKEWRSAAVAMLSGQGNMFGEAGRLPSDGLDKEVMCELCGYYYKNPLTYHMRQAHPGCGNSASGFGYNSSGTFCGGWAGQCGEGGVMGITWYLLCQQCRERYLKQKRQLMVIEKPKKLINKKRHSRYMTSNTLLEVHQVMKNNAMFLLQFSSASNGSLKSLNPPSVPLGKRNSYNGKQLSQQSIDLTHHNPFPNVLFQCLQTLGVNESELSMMSDMFFQGSKSFLGIPVCGSSIVPEFAHSLSIAQDDRVATPNPKHADFRKSNGVPGFRGSKSFHRSISVGVNPHDWQKMQDNSAAANADEEESVQNKSEVSFRRRNNSSGGGDGKELFIIFIFMLVLLHNTVTVQLR